MYRYHLVASEPVNSVGDVIEEYRYHLVASEPVKLDFKHSRETKLSVGDVIEEKGKPPVRVKGIERKAFAPFGLGWRLVSREGKATVALHSPDPETGAISKGMLDRQF